MKQLLALCLLPLALQLISSATLAVDGVIEINARAAQEGGITPGDAPGFPVTISRSGSYILTGDLLTFTRAQVLVDVSAARVNLDLNGFTVGACVTGLSCGLGSAPLIRAAGADFHVHNGLVHNAGGDCVTSIGLQRTVVENLRVRNCGATGIFVGVHSQVIAVNVSDTDDEGVRLGRGSLMRDSVISGSGSAAVQYDTSVLVENSVLMGNARAFSENGSGAAAAAGYRGCVIVQNGATEMQPMTGNIRNLGGNVCGSDTVCP